MLADEVLVAGQWRQGRGAPIGTVDPATGQVIATVHAASLDDVEDAVTAAVHAAHDPAWRELPAHLRARLLHRIADLVERDADRLSALQTADTGKCRTETRALVLSAAGTFRYTAAALETAEDAITPSRGPYVTMSVHEPIGVVGAITPWNSPIASDAQKLAPALAAGNAVVLKPAEWTPLVALALGRLVYQALTEAALPTALLSVLPGRGSVIGDAIVRHRAVGKITFTGGTSTGRTLAHAAADKLIPVSLELGGKSPTIVFDDADIEQALAGVMYGVFSSSGQSCIAGSRLFVARSRYEEFVGELVARTEKLRVGPGTDPDTQVAPSSTTSTATASPPTSTWPAKREPPSGAGERPPKATPTATAPTTSPPSSTASPTPPGSARKRSSAPCSSPCPSTTRTTLSPRPTTACTASPADCGPGTTPRPGGSPAVSTPERSGSTRTSSSASPPRSAG